MSIYTKLIEIQNELKAPKNQKNSFGGYNYRSCEDILEAVKPINKKYGCTLIISDSIEMIGERFYVKATATLTDCETGESVSGSAYAREALTLKGQSDSQVTGTTSSYARKYCLNGLYNIDDTKDADTDEFARQSKSAPYKATKTAPKKNEPVAITKLAISTITKMAEEKGVEMSKVLGTFKVNKLEELTAEQGEKLIHKLEITEKKGE